MSDNYRDNPRDYALELVEQGVVSADHLLLCALKRMSNDDIAWMLSATDSSSPTGAGV